MKKLIASAFSFFVLVLAANPAAALNCSQAPLDLECFCVVFNEIDQDAAPYNYYSLRRKVALFNANASCPVPPGTADTGQASQAIYFMTPEWDGTGFYANRVDAPIALTGPLSFSNPAHSLVVGNWSSRTTPATTQDYGQVTLDARTNFASDELPFSCAAGGREVRLRNLKIHTRGVSKSELFSRASCLRDAGNVTVCYSSTGIREFCDAGGVFETLAGATVTVRGQPDLNNGNFVPRTPPIVVGGGSSAGTDDDGDGYCEGVLSRTGIPECQTGAKGPGDCNDADAAVNPEAAVVCSDEDPKSAQDNNCDGVIDRDDTSNNCCSDEDVDGDGWTVGGCGHTTPDCADTSGNPEQAELCAKPDCDDSDAAINPAAAEICGDTDEKDEDCNPSNDDGSVWYPDSDGDGFGNASGLSVTACAASEGGGPVETVYSQCNGQAERTDADKDGDGVPAASGDCNDSNMSVNPSIVDLCDNVDNDCDPSNNKDYCRGEKSADDDGDGFSEDEGDCADTDAAIHPKADEVCGDKTDNDCDGQTDETVPYVTDNTDCDDAEAERAPGKIEICTDDLDNDCNSLADADDAACTGSQLDNDGDGFTPGDGDCDDANPSVNPSIIDLCDSVDNDCNELNDQDRCAGNPGTDDDGDGFSENQGDCDDGSISIQPDAAEVCSDKLDNDCDSLVDESVEGAVTGGGGCIDAAEVPEIPLTFPSTGGCSCDMKGQTGKVPHPIEIILGLILAPITLIGGTRLLKRLDPIE